MEKNYLLPDKAYQVLKWVAAPALPAFATFYGVVGPYWGLPSTEAVVVTLAALSTLIGTLIGVSAIKGSMSTTGGTL